MSGVVEPATLEQAIALANAVVVAVPADPPESVVMVSITPGGGPPTEKYPAFRQVFHRYRIEDVLHGDARAGSVIEVLPNSGGVTLDEHRLYHVENVHKILMHLEYQTSLTKEDVRGDPRRILLLNKISAGWMYAYGESVEPVRLRPRIEKLLASRLRRA